MGRGWKGRKCWAVMSVARSVGGTDASRFKMSIWTHVRLESMTNLPSCAESAGCRLWRVARPLLILSNVIEAMERKIDQVDSRIGWYWSCS
jgi:hypothetical protein